MHTFPAPAKANNNYLSVTADLTKMKSVVNFPTTTNQLPPTSTDGGLAAAIDAYTGEILWSFANPLPHWDGTGKRARSQAPMTVANDVVFYPSECLPAMSVTDRTYAQLVCASAHHDKTVRGGCMTACLPACLPAKACDSCTFYLHPQTQSVLSQVQW